MRARIFQSGVKNGSLPVTIKIKIGEEHKQCITLSINEKKQEIET